MFWLITGKKELDRCLKFNWLCHLLNIPWRLKWCISSCWSRGILCTSEFLKKGPFLLSPSTRESIPGRPLPRTRAFLGVFDNSRGVRDHGNFCCAAERIMGKLQKRKGTWEGKEALPAFRSSRDPLCRQKCGQEAAGYKGGVICEYLAFWCLCLSVYYIYGVVIFIAFAVNEKKLISQQFVGHHRSLVTYFHT